MKVKRSSRGFVSPIRACKTGGISSAPASVPAAIKQNSLLLMRSLFMMATFVSFMKCPSLSVIAAGKQLCRTICIEDDTRPDEVKSSCIMNRERQKMMPDEFARQKRKSYSHQCQT